MTDDTPLEKGIADALAQELLKPWDRYYWYLGQFIDSFASMEATVQDALWHFAGVNETTAKALFSGTKIEQSQSFIRRLLEAKAAAPEVIDEIEFIFAQLTIINTIRNKLVHHGAQFKSGEGLYVSDKRSVMPTREVWVRPISAEILRDMTSDLSKITRHFGVLLYSDQLPPHIRAIFQRSIDEPWRYIPPEQPRSDQAASERAGKRGRKPSRQRKASR